MVLSILLLGIDSVQGLNSLGLSTWAALSAAETFWDAVDTVLDVYAWAGEQMGHLLHTIDVWIRDFEASLAAMWEEFGPLIVGSFLESMFGDNLITPVGGQMHQWINYAQQLISNTSASDVLDGIQLALDVVGLIPGVGEVADGVNAAISLARGDYLGAGLSLLSMIPVVGDALGKGGKLTRAAIKKSDELMEAGKSTLGMLPNKGKSNSLKDQLLSDPSVIHNNSGPKGAATPGGRTLSDHAASESLVRHGFKPPFGQIDEIIKQAQWTSRQADGAIVHIHKQAGRGRSYSVVVEGVDGKVVTAMKDLSPAELGRLSSRYGFGLPW
ncbi:hypothetical protein SH449x_004429 [Pirellulaceae bacterium SH449]